MIADAQAAQEFVGPIRQALFELNNAIDIAARSGLRIEITTSLVHSVGHAVGYADHPVVRMTAALPIPE